MKFLSKVFLLVFISPRLFAWDGVNVGTIRHIDVTGAENYGFRIGMTNTAGNNLCAPGTPSWPNDCPKCGSGSQPWLYINKSNDNYQTYVATLTAAAYAQKQVTVFATRNPAHQQCEIGYISVQGF